MTSAIGENWSNRCYKTSTETFVSFKEFIHVWWGYKERKQYQHNNCKRCTWKDAEENRPQLCDPVILYVRGPSWIHVTFTRSRRNMVTGTVAKRRRQKNLWNKSSRLTIWIMVMPGDFPWAYGNLTTDLAGLWRPGPVLHLLKIRTIPEDESLHSSSSKTTWMKSFILLCKHSGNINVIQWIWVSVNIP